jgi:hypothetical protein
MNAVKIGSAVRRRRTIDSIGAALSVLSFARWVEEIGLSAKAMPAPPFCFCFAGAEGLNAFLQSSLIRAEKANRTTTTIRYGREEF